MANTGREGAATFRYLDEYVQPLMREIGCRVEVIPHENAKHDLYYISRQGVSNTLPLMPVWTRQNNGKLGQTRNLCSGFWKRDVVRDWLLTPEAGYGRKNPVIQWFGFSRDEVWRMKPSKVKWREHHYPLIQDYGLRMSRDECIQTILDFGLPEPVKSRCVMCPYQSNEEWREIKADPAAWQSAVDIDHLIRSVDKSNSVYLHRSGVPLVEADLSDKELPLWDYAKAECAESCWT